jgi:hypothetical protein
MIAALSNRFLGENPYIFIDGDPLIDPLEKAERLLWIIV